MATVWEKACHSVDHMFCLYFDFFNSSLFPFGFESGIWVLIAPDLVIAYALHLSVLPS